MTRKLIIVTMRVTICHPSFCARGVPALLSMSLRTLPSLELCTGDGYHVNYEDLSGVQGW